MKIFLAACAVMLVFAFNSFADIIYVPLDKAVKDSDLIIVGTLTNVTQPPGVAMEGGKSEIVFEEVIAGNVGTINGFLLETGDKMAYEFTEIICDWGSHKRIENEKRIFLLTLDENGKVKSADFRTLDQLPEIRKLLKKDGKFQKAGKVIKVERQIENNSQADLMENSNSQQLETSFGIYSLERKTNYRPFSALWVILVSGLLYYFLYRSRFKIR